MLVFPSMSAISTCATVENSHWFICGSCLYLHEVGAIVRTFRTSLVSHLRIVPDGGPSKYFFKILQLWVDSTAYLLSHGANIWTRRTGELHTWAALLDLQHSPTEWTENKHFLCSLLTELLGGYRSWERTVVDSTLPSLNRKSNATRKRSRDVDFLTTKPSAIYDNAKMFIDSKTCTYLRFTGNLHSSVCNQDHEQRHHIQESCHRKQQIV